MAARAKKQRAKAGYMISAVAELYKLHPQTLRLYERVGLLKPSRSQGNTRLYTDGDLERLDVILTLARDMGVNLAGMEVARLKPCPDENRLPRKIWRPHMALENCTLCRGTGWKLVPRSDGVRGNVAVACDCGMEERATRVMDRARIPKRYEHCDFESYVTDLTDGKTWTAQHSQSFKQANLLTQPFLRDYPASPQNAFLLMG